VIALKMPIAAPRFSAGNAALSRARPIGTTKAAPAPCTTRAAISEPTFGASAHAAEAAANSTMPTVYIRRRPNRSPRPAPRMSSTAKLRL
jgi:hypothetical protein